MSLPERFAYGGFHPETQEPAPAGQVWVTDFTTQPPSYRLVARPAVEGHQQRESAKSTNQFYTTLALLGLAGYAVAGVRGAILGAGGYYGLAVLGGARQFSGG